MSFERGLWATTLVLLISLPASAQEYRFHGGSAVDEGTGEDGAFSFPPNGYSPYKQRAAPMSPRNTVESLPTESWGAFPRSPYSAGQQATPWGGGYGYGYLPGGGTMPGMPYRGGVSPFNTFPGGGFLLPW